MITRRELLAMLTAAGVALKVPGEEAPALPPGPIENEGFEEGSDAWEVPDAPARFSWTPDGGKPVEIGRVESINIEMEPLEAPAIWYTESRPSGTGMITLESRQFWDCDLAAMERGRLRFGFGRDETFSVRAYPLEVEREMRPDGYSQRTVFRYWGPWTSAAE